jgi:hypothetical protein
MSAKTATPATVTGSATDINGVTVYSVPSRTSSDVYQLVERDGHVQCFCKGYAYRGHCAHLDAVATFKRQIAKQAAKMAKTPTPKAAHETAMLFRDNRPFSIFAAE